MTNLFTAILFSISSNLDNIVIGIAYGIKKIKIGLLSNLLVAIITTFGTFISMEVGKWLTNWLPSNITKIIGSGIITLLGLYFLMHSIINLLIKNKKIKIISLKNSENMVEYAEQTDKNNSYEIETKEAIAIGFGLMFNNIGTGIAASASGISILETCIFTFILSTLFILSGYLLGNKILGKFLGKYSPLISGILLIVLGIFQYLI